MKFLDAVFGQRGDKEKGTQDQKLPGKIAVCSNCEGREFMVFQLDGQTHLHLQCGMCGMSFCPVGACKV